MVSAFLQSKSFGCDLRMTTYLILRNQVSAVCMYGSASSMFMVEPWMSRSSVMTCTENLVSAFLMLNQRIFSADEKAWRTCLRRHSKPSCSFCAAECHQGRGRSNRARATLIGTGPAAILEPPLSHLVVFLCDSYVAKKNKNKIQNVL